MTRLYLVRHGLTDHTGHRLTGWMEGVHLNEAGRAQAEAAADALAGKSLAAVYSSPIDRTMETARAIAARHGLRVRSVKGLGEVGYGTWTGRPLKTLARTKLWGELQRWPSSVRFPEGETLREVQVRAVAEIERLQGLHPDDQICVVSHADTIRLAIAHYLGVHIDLFHRLGLAPASISILDLGGAIPRVVALNVIPGLL